MRQLILEAIETLQQQSGRFDKNSRWGVGFTTTNGEQTFKWLMDVPYHQLNDQDLFNFYNVVTRRFYKQM